MVIDETTTNEESREKQKDTDCGGRAFLLLIFLSIVTNGTHAQARLWIRRRRTGLFLLLFHMKEREAEGGVGGGGNDHVMKLMM